MNYINVIGYRNPILYDEKQFDLADDIDAIRYAGELTRAEEPYRFVRLEYYVNYAMKDYMFRELTFEYNETTHKYELTEKTL